MHHPFFVNMWYQNKFHLNRFKQKRGITFKENALDFVNQYQENQEQVVME
ncbi:unnamed protein product [Paramecium sonneborni]|uniref:Uncharacterized protein n=1 Tax=Paramecium sonneborni TaxID=65129 RepID=A0A8S1PDY7_9CILI|nr:unnamed protein product [Paramecium sonneborni]